MSLRSDVRASSAARAAIWQVNQLVSAIEAATRRQPRRQEKTVSQVTPCPRWTVIQLPRPEVSRPVNERQPAGRVVWRTCSAGWL
jgi:hypothetical protein